MKRAVLWLTRIAAVVLLYCFCDSQISIGRNQTIMYWQYAVLVVLQILLLYTFFKSPVTPDKYRVLRHVLALAFVLLFRWEAIAQSYEYLTPWSIIFGEFFKQLPYMLLLHVPVQIVFSVVFYHMERRKRVQVSQ